MPMISLKTYAYYRFLWLKGSRYIIKTNDIKIETHILDELIIKKNWLNLYMRDYRQTNIGKEYNKNYLFDKTTKILK